MLTHNGYPLKLYHGTCSEFEEFRPLSHFGTRKAATDIIKKMNNVMRYDGFIPIEKSIDSLFQDPFENQGEAKLIPVYLNIKNPITLPDLGTHDLKGYKNMLFSLLMREQLGSQWATQESLRQARKHHLNSKKLFAALCRKANFMSELHFIFDEPFERPYDEVKRELSLGKMYPIALTSENTVSTEDINRHHLAAQRMIRFFEARGYDGIRYNNKFEDRGDASYIIFRPEQVVRLDRANVSLKRSRKIRKNEVELEKIRRETLARIQPTPLSNEEIAALDFFEFTTLPKRKTNPESRKLYWIKYALRVVMPKIAKITNQETFGYHGLNHTEQVILHGIDYAIESGVKPLPVILACALHDCARTHDDYDEKHGKNCEPIARAFLKKHNFKITPKETEQIISAIAHHTTGRIAPNGISACLWDADRTRLSWERGYKEKFFTTARAKQIASLSKEEQQKYIEKQTALLDRVHGSSLLCSKHKIATKETLRKRPYQEHQKD